ncbi:MAG: hypothetical protein ACR2FY_04695 [Pirellulaceae bacterium]
MTVIVLLMPLLLAQATGLVTGIVMIVGAVKMMRLKSHGLATFASVLAMLPCGPAWLLGLPMGIWSLVVLNRRNVKEAFEARAGGRLPPIPSGTESGSILLARARILLVVALLLLPFIVLSFWFVRMRSAGSNQSVLEIRCDDGIKGAQVLVQQGGQRVTMIDTQIQSWAHLKPGLYQLFLNGSTTDSRTKSGPLTLSPSVVEISGSSRQLVRVFVQTDVVGKTASGVPAPDLGPSRGWALTRSGPALTTSGAGWLALKPTQFESVNRILQASYQEYLALEAQNTERQPDAAGHTVITIKPFPKEIAKLEDGLWSQLDKILNVQQQSVARLNLKLDAPELQPGMSVSDLVRPGFFGYGKDGARIELWRVGAWSHWKVKSRGNESSGRAPELPEEYRRFWKEPAGADPAKGDSKE